MTSLSVISAAAVLTVGALSGIIASERKPLPRQHASARGRSVVKPRSQEPRKAYTPFKWGLKPGGSGALVVSVSPFLPQRDKNRPLTEADLSRYFEVFVDTHRKAGDPRLPPILGRYRYSNRTLTFESTYPAAPGVTYRAELGSPGLPKVISYFQLPRPSVTATTFVRQIFPTASLLPENLLKFYVHFSAPMSRGQIYDHIRLRNEAGKDVELPFLEIDEELWDPTMTRLTLFIDPGRIKREVKPLEDIGPALEQGESFTLVIESTWKDASGSPLKQSYRKTFQVGPPDRDPPDPDQWQVKAPSAGTREPLIVVFPESMDNALSRRFLRVTNEAGASVAGAIEMYDLERRWTLTPSAKWGAGPHRLIVRTAIEDLAGNNIGKPFEVDLFDTVERNIRTATITLPFRVR